MSVDVISLNRSFFLPNCDTFLIIGIEFARNNSHKKEIYYSTNILIQTFSGMKFSSTLSVNRRFAKEIRTINKISFQFCFASLKKDILEGL